MTNPLLDIPFDIPFDQIRAEHVEPAIDQLIADAQAKLDAIADAPRTFADVLLALEDATERLAVTMTVVGHLESVDTSPELRDAYNVAQPKVSAFWSSISHHEGLYRAVKELSETPEAKALDPLKKRLLDKTLDSFRRGGAALGADDKKRLAEIDVALAEATNRYGQNTLDATNDFELVLEDEEKLEGLPESARSAAKASAESKGVEGWRFTLQAPSLLAVLSYLDDATIREQVWRAYNTRASGGERDNRELIVEILKLRREKAKLLGYPDFADFVLEDRMAKSGAAAQEFVADLDRRTRPRFEEEKAELQAFRRELEGDDAPPLQPWDVRYYSEKLRHARYEFDGEVLRPYFPIDRVMNGLFTLAGKVFGIEVREREAPTWDDSVRTFGIYDAGTDTLRAAFYADLYPRESKRGGAWMNGLISGASLEEMGPHLGLICANVTPPVNGKPALLTHREVQTLFHEFGHLLHGALSEVPIKSLGGTNVAWDFVELPSQIMENFCWERESLDLFAQHHETGERIPDELFERMRKARTFQGATAQMRQLGFAAVDLYLHRSFPEDGDAARMMDEARKILGDHASAPVPDDYAMICSFHHLFASATGYAAGYYSYKWAEVLDADAFTRFAADGVLSEEVGRAFRRDILSRGDSADPDELYRRFMGRDPELDALLNRIGLAA